MVRLQLRWGAEWLLRRHLYRTSTRAKQQLLSNIIKHRAFHCFFSTTSGAIRLQQEQEREEYLVGRVQGRLQLIAKQQAVKAFVQSAYNQVTSRKLGYQLASSIRKRHSHRFVNNLA